MARSPPQPLLPSRPGWPPAQSPGPFSEPGLFAQRAAPPGLTSLVPRCWALSALHAARWVVACAWCVRGVSDRITGISSGLKGQRNGRLGGWEAGGPRGAGIARLHLSVWL